MQTPFLTIVISSYNRAEKLRLALEGIKKQVGVNKDQFEVWVVDNNSTDHSQAVAESFRERLNLHFVIEELQGLGHVRNKGYLLAQGEYVAYLDDDAIPDPEWISAILQVISHENPDCVCGPIFPYYDSEKPMWFLDEYETRSKGDRQRLLRPGEECSGSNMIWKKKTIDKLGGIDSSMGMKENFIIGGEDTALFKKYWSECSHKESKIVYSPNIRVLHWTPAYKMNVKYILNRAFAAGIAAARIRKEEDTIKKGATSIRLIFEMIYILLRFPLMRFRYQFKENWIVEELRRLYLRMGWLSTYLGFSKDPVLTNS